MRLGLACRLFAAALFQPRLAEALERVLSGGEQLSQALPEPEQPRVAPREQPAATRPAGRSDALTLLEALQREARLLDLVQEPLSGYADAQIGAAARDVLRQSATVLDRFFGLQKLRTEAEGSSIEVPSGYDPQLVRLVGAVSGQPPFRGQLVHPGWQATRCELPTWSGSPTASRVLAPAEVEIGARG